MYNHVKIPVLLRAHLGIWMLLFNNIVVYMIILVSCFNRVKLMYHYRIYIYTCLLYTLHPKKDLMILQQMKIGSYVDYPNVSKYVINVFYQQFCEFNLKNLHSFY